jgi:hypothetical protein
VERPDRLSCETIEVVAREPTDRPLTAVHKFALREEGPAGPDLADQRWEDYRSSLLSMDAIADETFAELPGSCVADIALSTQLMHELKELVRYALILHCGGLQAGIPAGMIAH